MGKTIVYVVDAWDENEQKPIVAVFWAKADAQRFVDRLRGGLYYHIVRRVVR